MAEEAMNRLRRRIVEDMTARNLSEAAQRGYIRAVRVCCQYCGRAPTKLTLEDARRFQLQLLVSGQRRPAVGDVFSRIARARGNGGKGRRGLPDTPTGGRNGMALRPAP